MGGAVERYNTGKILILIVIIPNNHCRRECQGTLPGIERLLASAGLCAWNSWLLQLVGVFLFARIPLLDSEKGG